MKKLIAPIIALLLGAGIVVSVHEYAAAEAGDDAEEIIDPKKTPLHPSPSLVGGICENPEDCPRQAAPVVCDDPMDCPGVAPVICENPEDCPIAAQPKFPPAVDPVEHPAAAYQAWQDVKKEMGVLGAILFALFCLATLLQKHAKPGSFFDRGRLPLIITMVAAASGAVGGAWAGDITWTSALFAIGTAFFASLNPAPAKAIIPRH